MGPSAQRSVAGKTRKYCHDRYAIAVMKQLPGRLVASVLLVICQEKFPDSLISLSFTELKCRGRVRWWMCITEDHHLCKEVWRYPVEMAMTDTNSVAIDKYKQLGKFPQEILEAMKSPSDEELDYKSQSQSRITVKINISFF